jgi:hypothetical protein
MRTRLALICAVLAVAPAVLNPLSQRIAVAQTREETPPPEETPPGTFTGFLKQQWATPKSDEPVPDTARDTIDTMRRARGRASGTPQPEPTPRWGL